METEILDLPTGWTARKLANWHLLTAPSGEEFLAGETGTESRALGHRNWVTVAFSTDAITEADSLDELLSQIGE